MKRRLFTVLSVLVMIIGLISINTSAINAEDTTDYLCFTSEEANSTVKLTKTGILGIPTAFNLETSVDKVNWTPYTIDSTITLMNIGDKVYFRNTSETTTGFSYAGVVNYRFVTTGKIAGSGDVTTLINKNGTLDLTSTDDGCFSELFSGCTSLTTAPKLPATTIGFSSYQLMFSGCTNLIVPPELPATDLKPNCYNGMFSGCTSLLVAPELPAMVLSVGCYESMFSGCTSLLVAPELPAMVLSEGCYESMFNECENLAIAPELPATMLANDCYRGMFCECTSLISPPELPATVLADSCYCEMFDGCTNINISETYSDSAAPNEKHTIQIRIPSSDYITTRASDDLFMMFLTTSPFSSISDNGTPVDSNTDGVITLYLHPTNVSITYDANGADSGIVPTDGPYTVLDTVTAKGNTGSLTKIEKIFRGWSLRPDGKGKVYNPDDTFAIRGNMTLYARWDEYYFTSGSSQTYTKGTLENKLFTCDGPLANLTSVQIDDVEITETSQYTKEEGSTKITLLGSYLETLDLGSHTLKLTYSDGPIPTVTFTVVNPSTPEPEPMPAPAPNNNAFVIPNTGIIK